MSKLLTCALFFVVSFANACHKNNVKKSRAAELNISRGELDSGHPQVGQVWGTSQACTGTLIGPQVVLTAAHCLLYRTADGVIPDATFSLASGNYISRRLKVHPLFKKNVENEFDIALLLLEKPVTDVTPATLSTTMPVVGQAIQMVGFGADSNSPPNEESPQGFPTGSGVKRHAPQTIAEVSPSWFKFYGLQNTWHGDSGGPSFVSIAGQEFVQGVHSTASFEQWGVDASVAAHCQWIKDVVGALPVRFQSTQCPAVSVAAH